MAGSAFRFRLWFLVRLHIVLTRGALLFLWIWGGWLSVDHVHAYVDILADPQDDRLGGLGDCIFNRRTLGRFKAAEHVVCGVDMLTRRPDPDPQPGVIRGPQVFFDAAKPLLTAVGSPG